MSDELKKMDIKEFRELGFLQEINRRVLHPCGLAMAVSISDEGEETLGFVIDSRDDPEGFYYVGSDLKPKRDSVDALIDQKREHRERVLGYVIQPVEETP